MGSRSTDTVLMRLSGLKEERIAQLRGALQAIILEPHRAQDIAQCGLLVDDDLKDAIVDRAVDGIAD